ncbi:HAD family hydrolase [Candidatus Microgenomates bacterium]|nr:HAD family hydrolase [Candidatus Microgenomates bacterium]
MKTVLFDIDGVLIDSRKASNEFYKNLLFRIGGKIPHQKDLDLFFVITLKESIKHFYPHFTEKEIKEAQNLSFEIYPHFHCFEKLAPYARSVLKKLKRKYQLGIVTGRLSARVFDHFKLTSSFDVIITAQNYTHPKPHPEPLLMAIKKLKTTPRETVYIGDSKSDSGAAKEAGVSFIAYKNKSLKTPYHLSDFRQLPRLLSKIFHL